MNHKILYSRMPSSQHHIVLTVGIIQSAECENMLHFPKVAVA